MNITLRHGDCFEVLKELESNSVGSVICDPPYGLEFMGKDFDTLGDGKQQRVWHKGWVAEVYRVLKPEGVLKAFSGTRTYHHMATAMEEVGFDIGLEAWCYGSGFPKSLNVAMAIDKAARGQPQGGPDPLKRGGESRPSRNVLNMGGGDGKAPTGLSDDYGKRVLVTEEAKKFECWGTALKPAWEPIVVGRKPTL